MKSLIYASTTRRAIACSTLVLFDRRSLINRVWQQRTQAATRRRGVLRKTCTCQARWITHLARTHIHPSSFICGMCQKVIKNRLSHYVLFTTQTLKANKERAQHTHASLSLRLGWGVRSLGCSLHSWNTCSASIVTQREMDAVVQHHRTFGSSDFSC